MKKTILSIAIAVIFAACSQQPATVQPVTKDDTSADSSGLAQFKQWKQQQQDLIGAPQVNEAENSFNTSSVQEKSKPPVIIYRTVKAKRPIVRVTKPAPRSTPVESTTPAGPATTTSGSSTTPNSNTTGVGTTSPDGTVATTTPPVKEEKKGWSKAAQGTVIGAGSGAVLGAILTKDKAKGAIIGGIIGAGAGYGLGRMKDKKDGRY